MLVKGTKYIYWYLKEHSEPEIYKTSLVIVIVENQTDHDGMHELHRQDLIILFYYFIGLYKRVD